MKLEYNSIRCHNYDLFQKETGMYEIVDRSWNHFNNLYLKIIFFSLLSMSIFVVVIADNDDDEIVCKQQQQQQSIALNAFFGVTTHF